MNPSREKVSLATRLGALAFFEHYQGVSREQFTRHGKLRPHAVLMVTRTPDGQPLPPETQGEPGLVWIIPDSGSKEEFAEALGDTLERTHAIGLVLVMETWLASGNRRADFPSDLSTPFPGRREAILLTLEHVALERPVVAVSIIERTAAGKGNPGPFRQDGVSAEGRFMHLLKRAAS